MSAAAVQNLLDERIASLSKEWKATIPFQLYAVEIGTEYDASIFTRDIETLDICSYLNGQNNDVTRLYFCPKKYPPPANDQEMEGIDETNKCTSWQSLKKELETVCFDLGNPIVCNGSQSSGKNSDGKRLRNNRRFICGSLGRTTQVSKAQPITATAKYRETSLVNNRKNNRQGGLSGPKRHKRNNNKNTCPFGFTVKWDRLGFYVDLIRRSGNPMHCYHPQVFKPSTLSFPTRLLSDDQIDDTRQVVEATCNKAIGRNFIHGKFGRFINSIKIAYLAGRKANGDKDSKKSDIVHMLADFEDSAEIAFTTVADVPNDELTDDLIGDRTTDCNETVTVSTTQYANEEVVNTEISTLDYGEDIETAAKKERKEKKLKPRDILFVAIAWIVLPAFRFFKLCPEVIWCDVTSHSNNKGFHLLTFSCRTSVDKQVVFMWIWIPNQQRFSFRWVFQHAIPNLIPEWLRRRVKFIMKDGDPQQRNEIIMAMNKIFPNAKEGGCGFHIGKKIIRVDTPTSQFVYMNLTLLPFSAYGL